MPADRPSPGRSLQAQNLRARILPGIAALPEIDWTRCFPDEVEGWAYYAACERGAAPSLSVAAAAVFDGDDLIAAAPLFRMSYRLDTPLQGRLERVGRALARHLPGLVEWRMLGVGSPFAERCHVALRPGLTVEGQARALGCLLDAVEGEARHAGAPLIAFKDVAAPEMGPMAPLLRARGYHSIRSLPVAVLDLRDGSVDAYLARLSAGTRKDLRRKLKGAGAVHIEHRAGIGDLGPQIAALYESTRQNSQLRYGEFEDLPDGYFPAVAAALGERAHIVLYRVGDRLAAFNLLLLEPDRVIDKFLGMAYPLARDHNLYAVSWMENVRFAISTGRRLLQSGQTAYASKVRFGSDLVPSTNFARHRWPLVNRAIGAAAPLMAFDRWDPDLRALRQRAAA